VESRGRNSKSGPFFTQGSRGVKGTVMCDEPKEKGLGEVADDGVEIDEVTGASPGTAQACDDLGLNSLEANLSRFNIKPPGQS